MVNYTEKVPSIISTYRLSVTNFLRVILILNELPTPTDVRIVYKSIRDKKQLRNTYRF